MLGRKLNELYQGLSVTKKNYLKTVLLCLMQMPVVGEIYRRIYTQVIRRQSAKLPKWLTIETHNRCNLKCIMCPYQKMTRKKGRMDMALFHKIIDDAREFGMTDLCLSGYGEPLLDDLIFERVKYAKGKGMKVWFNSNGTLLMKNDNIDRILNSGLDWIAFSVDAADKETYERIRVGAKFEDVVNGINELIRRKRELNQEQPKIEIECIVQKENYQQLSQNRKQLRKLFRGADTIRLTPVDFRADERAYIPLLRIRKSPKSTYPCHMIWDHMFVLNDGSVPLCLLDYNGVIRIGNLRTYSIEEIWYSQKFKKIRDLHLAGKGREIRLCRKCDKLNVAAPFRWWSSVREKK